jgi:L-amino acid N-acyltransferase YncA
MHSKRGIPALFGRLAVSALCDCIDVRLTNVDFLSPEEHGRGIMPVALRLLMEKYLIPSLNAHRVIGVFFDYNTASKRVFEKNGFEFMGVTPNAIELSEAKTGVKGKKVGLGTMIWERKLEP